MTSIALEPRAHGPRDGDRPPGGADGARRDSPRAIDAPGSRGEDSRRGDGAGLLNALAGEAVTFPTLLVAAIALVAPPLLTRLPIVRMGLLVQAIGTLFGGIS